MKQNQNNSIPDASKNFKNDGLSPLQYVQNAVENVTESTDDATQELVNNVMKRRRDRP